MQEVVAHWNEYPLPRQQNLFAAAVLHALEVGACCWWLLSVLMPGRSPNVLGGGQGSVERVPGLPWVAACDCEAPSTCGAFRTHHPAAGAVGGLGG